MKKTNEDAVSPVVGVMLMLVVTIIIAAVVTGYSSGIAGNTEAAPSASIDVKAYTSLANTMGGTRPVITIEMLSGDPIPTRDLQIITYYTSSDTGSIYKNTISRSNEPVDIYGYGTSVTRIPFLNDRSKTGGSGSTSAWFGNFTFSTGDILSTYNAEGTGALLGCKIGTGFTNFSEGETIDFKILHVPSEKYIYDKEVVIK